MEKRKGHVKGQFAQYKHSPLYTTNNTVNYVVIGLSYTNIYYLYKKKQEISRDTIAQIERRSVFGNWYFKELPKCIDKVENLIDSWTTMGFSTTTADRLKKVFKNVSHYLKGLPYDKRKEKMRYVMGYLFEGVNAVYLTQYYSTSWPGSKSMIEWFNNNKKGGPDIKVYNNNKWISIECKFRSNPFYYFQPRELQQVLDADVGALTYKPLNKEIDSQYYVLATAPKREDVFSYLMWIKNIYNNQLRAWIPMITYLSHH